MPSPNVNTYGAVPVTTTPLAVTEDAYAGQKAILSRAAGITATLPAATGSGAQYRFLVATTVTSNAYIIRVANAADVMAGVAIIAQDAGDTSVLFETAADSDTITLNGTTTGGLRGAEVLATDMAANLWHVRVISAATGTEATPFSAAVS